VVIDEKIHPEDKEKTAFSIEKRIYCNVFWTL